MKKSLSRLKHSLANLKQNHKSRHTPTGFGFVFADRIDYLDPHRWDAIASSASVFLNRDVLRAIETAGPENVSPRYAIVFRDTTPVAILAVQIVTVTGAQLQKRGASEGEPEKKNLLKRVLAPATRTAVSRLREKMLVAGNLLAWGCHGLAFAAGENAAALWPAVAEAIYRIRRAEKLTGQTDLVMIKDLTEANSGTEALKAFSYRPLETEPNMVLEIDAKWKTYDDYLAALDAKYRRKVKDQLKKLEAAGCRVAPVTNLSVVEKRIHELYLSVQGNATVRLVTLPETFLPALSGALGEAFRCTGIWRGETLVGFVTSVKNGDTSIGYYIGFDRAVAAETGAPLYLTLLHATIADAIHWRCQRLSLGRTALEPKAGLGAKPEPMTVWLRHRVPALNWAIRGLLTTVSHAEAPERNPFKVAPANASDANSGGKADGN